MPLTAAQQHRYEVWASNLLFLTFAISTAVGLLVALGYLPRHRGPAQYGYLSMYTAAPPLLVVYYYIRRGARVAKILFLLLYAFVLLQIISGWRPLTSYATPAGIVHLLAQQGLQIGACVLLFLSFRTPTKPI
ncbi:hypothetical protein [Hymenobacter coccineus]|uniref:Uncharacterized protein n=1 Tax=Hymenobacter coccineus TaxID=1908235 RepID=A0A1G1TK84_9BACT|nr:hypothetical protein [Hymenobacter coccineus]OGX91268.1 hypothetical protein BEN49_20445 [Hymenobacter coccineus]